MTVVGTQCIACGSSEGSGTRCGACRQPRLGADVGAGQRYRIEGLLARGLDTCTWSATDRLQGNSCVLQTYRAREEHEPHQLVSAASRLLVQVHPRLPAVREVFNEDGGDLVVVAFDRRPGTTVQEIVAERGPLPSEDVIELGAQLCDGLRFLASYGLGHEALTPLTVALAPWHGAHLLTLTIARPGRVGSTAGGPDSYAAPELANGLGGTGAGIYALAGCLVFALTGHDPPSDPFEVERLLVQGGVASAEARLLARCRDPEPVARPSLDSLTAALTPVRTDETPTLVGWGAEDRTTRVTPDAGARTGIGGGADTGPAFDWSMEQPSTPGRPDLFGILEMARYLEQSGDLYGALDLYRAAVQQASPTDELGQSVRHGLANLEARIAEQQSPRLVHQHALVSRAPGSDTRGDGPSWLTVILLCTCLVLAGAGLALWFWPSGQPQSPVTSTPPTAITVPPLVAPPPNPTPPRPDPRTLTDLADNARKEGDFGRALEALDRAKALTPPPAGLNDLRYQVYLDQGQHLLERGEHDASLESYQKALEIRPGDRAAQEGQRLVNLVRNRDRMEAAWGKDEDAAIAAAEANFAIDPEWRETREKLYALLIARAERLWRAGNRTGAREQLDRAGIVNPNGGEVDRLMTAWFATPTPVPPTATPRPVPPAPVVPPVNTAPSQPRTAPVPPAPQLAPPAPPPPPPRANEGAAGR